MNKKETARNEAREQLKNYITTKSEILIIIKSVSASGMCRRMKVLTSDHSDITYLIGQLIGWSVNDKGLRVDGCGMDMAFHLADTITWGMWGQKRNKIKTFKGNGGSCIGWKTA